LLNPDYRDMLFALSDEHVEFLIVGAFAMAAHGLPRATGDIDLWVRPSPANAARVWRAIERFGAPLFDLTREDLATPDMMVQIGVAPRRIDIITSIDGVHFDEAWAERRIIDLEGRLFATLSRAHLLKNKQAAGRPKDLADAAWLEAGPDAD
jgi:hypothetical protein